MRVTTRLEVTAGTARVAGDSALAVAGLAAAATAAGHGPGDADGTLALAGGVLAGGDAATLVVDTWRWTDGDVTGFAAVTARVLRTDNALDHPLSMAKNADGTAEPRVVLTLTERATRAGGDIAFDGVRIENVGMLELRVPDGGLGGATGADAVLTLSGTNGAALFNNATLRLAGDVDAAFDIALTSTHVLYVTGGTLRLVEGAWTEGVISRRASRGWRAR